MRSTAHLGWIAALPGFAIAGFALAAPAAAAVNVSFVEAERFTDASSYRYRGPASPSVLRSIETHLVKLGERHIPASRTLRIEVLDIDLAGEFEPFRVALYDVRVLRGVTWPRIRLRYSLEENGQVISAAEETIADQSYLFASYRFADSDSLYYEKRMLDDWFRRRFGEKQAAE